MTQFSDSDQQPARGRLLQVLRFLKDFNQLRNPVKRLVSDHEWLLWAKDIPEDTHVEWQGLIEAAPLHAPDDPDPAATEESVVLRVRRPTKVGCPEPPNVLSLWLRPGWDDPFNDAVHFEEQSGTEGQVEHFFDDADLEANWTNWKALRDEWAKVEAPHRLAGSLYNRLFDLRSRIQRESESYQLVVGDGILNWHPGNLNVHHPLLLKPIDLEFDEHVPEFRLVETLSEPELYLAPILDAPISDNDLLREARAEVAQGGGLHPLEESVTGAFFERFVHRLSPNGRLLDEARPTVGSPTPEIYRSPVVLLRKRTSSFGRFIEDALADLEQPDTEVPLALARTVGVAPLHAEGPIAADSTSFGNLDEQVLFALPANIEQLRIAQRLSQHGTVTVQGPPGTGKTHTIANLIGHLLAEGKTVLVTAQTSKALQVLKDKLPKPLQGLAVSVLDRDQLNRSQLESVVQAISETLSGTDADAEERKVSSLQQQRYGLLNQIGRARADLLHAREAEYRVIDFEGRAWTPSEASRWVAATNLGWIPRPVEPLATLPLSNAEIEELYELNARIGPEEEVQVEAGLVNPADLSSPAEFAGIVRRLAELTNVPTELHADCWSAAASKDTNQILSALSAATMAAQFLDTAEPWLLDAIDAGRLQNNMVNLWTELVQQVEEIKRQAEAYEEARVRFAPAIRTTRPTAQALTTLIEIEAHLNRGGRLGFLLPLLHWDWHKLRRNCQVNDITPSTVDEFAAIRSVVVLQRAREDIIRTWNRLVGEAGGPLLDHLTPAPESLCFGMVDRLTAALEWYATAWLIAVRELETIGLFWAALERSVSIEPGLHRELNLIRVCATTVLKQAVEERVALLERTRLHGLLSEAKHVLRLQPDLRIHRDLALAINEMDAPTYRAAHQELDRLHTLTSAVKRKNDLLTSLGRVAPPWVQALKGKIAVHGFNTPPGDATDAWLWAQLTQQLDVPASMPFEDVQARIASLTEELERVTAELVAVSSWVRQIRRTTYDQNRALKELARVFKQIGKGTGRRAPRLQREARRLMSISQEAVPVWIMPIARVVEQFTPGVTHFDVVIIDESSQADLLGLLPLYLGKQVVVVGDDEQVSPEGVGVLVEREDQLRNNHLLGVPGASLYGATMSVYDMAKIAFPGVVMLQEHFRCVPDIIQFSSHLSYEGKILPLRDPSKVPLQPAVVPYRVDAALREGDKNEDEALAVASLVIAAAEQSEYEGMSFGVVVTLGHEQAVLIESILRQRWDVSEYEHRRLLCGEPPNFQGDERDVMFVSTVYTPSADGRPLPLLSDQGGRFKKRFNVAASRARDQEWVVHSLDPLRDLQPTDLRRRFLEFAQNPRALDEALARTTERAESEFERQVLARLMERGYRVEPQYKVGGYRIDMVVKDRVGKTLAIECDGDRYHPLEKLPEDALRQATLERMDYTFVRLRGTEFFRNPEKAMEPVFAKLSVLGIAADSALTPEGAGNETSELVQRVIRRAQELRRQWDEEKAGSANPGDVMGDSQASTSGGGSGREHRSNDVQLPLLGQSAPSPDPNPAVVGPSVDTVTDEHVLAEIYRAIPEADWALITHVIERVATALGDDEAPTTLKRRVGTLISAAGRARRLEVLRGRWVRISR